MYFTLTINGDTPAELLDALHQLGGTTNIINNSPTPPPAVRHPAQAPLPQSEPVTQPDKPKAQTRAKPKEAAQKPAAAPAEEPADPTAAEAPASASPEAAGQAAADPDPATLDKIRDLARSLIVHGKRAEVQAAIQSTGAVSISKLPPESYTAVWEQLCQLKDEVDADAAG